MAASKLTFHYLSEQDVIKVGLSLSECIELCTGALKEHGEKQIDNPPKIAIHPLPDAFFHAMPAWLKQRNECGMKWVSGFPANVQKKLPTIVGTICLNDITTGFPTAFMDGTYITAIRTAAVSGVGAKFLARANSEVLAIIGTGVQGKYNTLSLTHVLPSIKTVKIFDKWEPSLKSFQETIGPLLGPRVTIEVSKTMEEAITGADVIVTATGKLLEPVFSDQWVKPGALVLPVHTAGWNKDVLTKMDKVVTDDWDQFSQFTKSVYNPIDKPHAELGEVVIGKKAGRENDQERIIDFNVGLAIHDIVVGNRVLKKAKEQGLGTELELMDLSVPIPLPPIV